MPGVFDGWANSGGFQDSKLKKKKEKKCIGLIEKSLVFAALYHIYRPYAGLPLGSIQPFTQ